MKCRHEIPALNTRKLESKNDTKNQVLNDLSGMIQIEMKSCHSTRSQSPTQTIDDSKIKWGEGFLPNLDAVLWEFILYRGVQPLKILFISPSRNHLTEGILQEVCLHSGALLISLNSILAESRVEDLSSFSPKLGELLGRLDLKRRFLIQESELFLQEKAKKKLKNAHLYEITEGNVDSFLADDELIGEIIRAKLEDNLTVYTKGVFFFDLANKMEEMVGMYEKGVLGRVDLLVEMTCNDQNVHMASNQMIKEANGEFYFLHSVVAQTILILFYNVDFIV